MVTSNGVLDRIPYSHSLSCFHDGGSSSEEKKDNLQFTLTQKTWLLSVLCKCGRASHTTHLCRGYCESFPELNSDLIAGQGTGRTRIHGHPPEWPAVFCLVRGGYRGNAWGQDRNCDDVPDSMTSPRPRDVAVKVFYRLL